METILNTNRLRTILAVLLLTSVPLASAAAQTTRAHGRYTDLFQSHRSQAADLVRLAHRVRLEAGKTGAATLLQRKTQATWDGSWVPMAEERYTYAAEHRTQATGLAWNPESGGFDESARTSYTYSGDLLVEALVEIRDSGTSSFVASERTTYVYAPGSQPPTLQVEVLESWDGSAWVPQHRWAYTTVSPEEQFMILHQWTAGRWQLVERDTYTEVGPDLVETTDAWGGSEWVPATRTVYHATTIQGLVELGEALSSEFENYPDLSRFFALWPETTEYYAAFGGWFEDTRSLRETDGFGRVVRLSVGPWSGGTLQGGSRYVFDYGTAGGMVGVDLEMMDETGEWQPFLRETYVLNAALEIEQATKMADFMGTGTMVPMERFEYAWGGGATSVETPEQPARATLDAAWPNPFNPSTTVAFSLREPGEISVTVLDALGRTVQTLVREYLPAGEFTTRFEAGAHPSGVYLVVLDAPGLRTTKPITLVK